MKQLKFIWLKLLAYLVLSAPVVGVSFKCFGLYGEEGIFFAIPLCMFVMHIFLTSESGIEMQKHAVMRFRHFLKM